MSCRSEGDRLFEAFDNAYQTSDDMHKEMERLLRIYTERPDLRIGIDNALVSICGWSMPSLVEQAGLGSSRFPEAKL